MKLGAQLYSVRNQCKTPEGVRETFGKLKEIGYEVVQLSGICDVEPEMLRSFSEEFSLPITSTHKSYKDIVENTKSLIEYHKIIGSPIIGIGGMPTEYRTSLEGVRKFIEETREPIKMIRDAGLSFTYHNHSFEFAIVDGAVIYDVLLEEAPEMDFIHDVCWSTYAGVDPLKYIELIVRDGRMKDVHLKDLNKIPTERALPADGKVVCPCGEGLIDFKPIIELCDKYGVVNAQVEQDNAPDLGDVFVQMKSSFDHLFPIITESRK